MSTGKTIALIKGLGNGGGSGLPTGGEPYKQLVTDENGEAVWSPIAGKNVTGTVYKISGSDVTAGKGAEIFNDYANNKATGQYSHAEGSYTIASGIDSHAEGRLTIASGNYSHAEGYFITASGNTSHAEGQNTTASGNTSHAEGQSTTASGIASHAEGHSTTASGNHSHAEGQSTTASGIASHAEGIGTTATVDAQHAQGKWNKEDTEGKYAHIVGNGTNKAPSNAHTIDWNGNGWFAGTVEGTALILSSPDGSRWQITVDDTGALATVKL